VSLVKIHSVGAPRPEWAFEKKPKNIRCPIPREGDVGESPQKIKVLVTQVCTEHHVGKHEVCCAGVAEHKILWNDMAQLLRRADNMHNLNAKSRSSTRGGSLTWNVIRNISSLCTDHHAARSTTTGKGKALAEALWKALRIRLSSSSSFASSESLPVTAIPIKEKEPRLL